MELCSRVHGVHGRDIDNQSSIRLNTVELSVWGAEQVACIVAKENFFFVGKCSILPTFYVIINKKLPISYT